MFKGIDLFSDTVTRPSDSMKKEMINAQLGDEQKGEDPTTKRLEEMVAQMLGFEASMFFTSATMANEIAIRILTEPGDELLAAENAHLFTSETGGIAIHSGVMARPISTKNGLFNAEQLSAAYRWSKGPHYPRSTLLSIENTTNLGGGVAWELANIKAVLEKAKDLKLKAHLDGARLFNAAVKLNLKPREITDGFDTITLCLSKGLGCPFGALLVFSNIHYDKVRRLKQLWGGAMRQSGILAAAGIYALENNIERLQEDHDNASYLAHCMSEEITTVQVENETPSTNMVFFRWDGKYIKADQFNQTCIKNGLRFSQVGENRFRAVTHLDITRQDIDAAITILKKIDRS